MSANTLTNPQMISLQSTHATGPQCPHNNVCLRYEWFSKVMLSGLVADFIYTQHGCTACHHIDVTNAAFKHNITLPENFGDGLHDDGSDWTGHYYPRGIISWAFLDAGY
jgi:hypothetical protein